MARAASWHESGRYELYASLADPWSHRALIARRLLGLERVIGLSADRPDPRRTRLAIPRLDRRP